MAVATFHTLKLANTLKTAGAPPQQAELMAAAFGEAFQQIESKSAANADMPAAAIDLRRAMSESGQRLGIRIDEVTADLLRDFRVLRWMLAVTLAATMVLFLVTFELTSRLP